MSTRRLSKNEIGERGAAIYESDLRSKLEEKSRDQFVAIDVETAEYEVAEEAHLAGNRLRVRLPDPQIFIAKVGHRDAFFAR